MSIRMAQLEDANKRLTRRVQQLEVELTQCKKDMLGKGKFIPDKKGEKNEVGVEKERKKGTVR